VPVLQQARVAGKTQFLLEMSALAEYDHVRLSLSSRNYIVHARVEGSDDPHAKRWAALSDNILYDFTQENLGGCQLLRLPRSTFKYLRVTLDGPITPQDVTGATSEIAANHVASWQDVGQLMKEEQRGEDTLFSFSLGEGVPVERIVFAVSPGQPNFKREVEIQDDKGGMLGSGEINRIHMVRSGQKIDSEQDEVELSSANRKTISVIVHNGDDPPLKLDGVRLQQLERRIYFDAPAQSALTLYYGDDKLEPPTYDYAKLFVRDPSAGLVQAGAETANPVYSGRPDDRPWSDRHPAMLWIAILAAVGLLGGLALRSLRAAGA